MMGPYSLLNQALAVSLIVEYIVEISYLQTSHTGSRTNMSDNMVSRYRQKLLEIMLPTRIAHANQYHVPTEMTEIRAIMQSLKDSG